MEHVSHSPGADLSLGEGTEPGRHRSGDCHPASHHKVAWLDTRTNDMEISRCIEHTLGQDRHTTQAARLTDRHTRAHPIHTSWTQPGPRNSTRVVTGGSHTGLVRQLP